MYLVATHSLNAVEVQWQLIMARFDEWLQTELFHWRWWFLLALFIFSIFIWWKLVDKSRLAEIVLYASMITIITLVLDELGEELCLWDYPVDLVPIFPPLFSVDLASLPIVYSLIYMYFSQWKKFIIATLAMALIFCFILEPVLVLIGIYQPLTWKYYYGFPIYSVMAICVKAVIIKLLKISEKGKTRI